MARGRRRGTAIAEPSHGRRLPGPAVVGIALLAGLAVGAVVVLVTEVASRSETAFKGNSALALLFSLGPAGATACWLAMVAWWYGDGRWFRPAALAAVIGSLAALVANLTPYLLTQAGVSLSNSFFLGTVGAFPILGLLAGLALTALIARVTRASLVAAVGVALLGVAVGVGLMGYFFILSPLLLLLAFTLPPSLARAGQGRVGGRPSLVWLWPSLAVVPLMIVAAVLFLPRLLPFVR